MNYNLNLSAALIVILNISACSRSAKTADPVPTPNKGTQTGEQKPGTEGGANPEVAPPSDDPNGSILSDDTIQVEQSGLCLDVSGKEMSGQFQDKTKNSPTIKTADCYDKAGALIYKGNASNCLEEMQARFGPDIVFPAQQVFPKQYEAARAQGANGQAALKTTLSSTTCKDLKAKE